MRRTVLLTAACAGVLAGTPTAAQPLVSVGDITVTTGDVDVLEDVLEHITILGRSAVTDTLSTEETPDRHQEVKKYNLR